MDEKKAKILIVDDHPHARETLKALLLPEGYDLALAASGAEALACLDELRPDTILLDVMMPDLDGFAVCRQLKTEEQWRHIPVILITALDSKKDLARGFDAGADDFLHKPVNGIELRARVRSMLRVKKQFDEMQANLKLREDMASMIVHDMRVPLTSILGFSELLLMKSDVSPGHISLVEFIHSEGRRLSSFLNDMLMLAKMEHGNLILNRSMVDVNQLVQTLQQSHDVVVRSRKIKLNIEIPEMSRQVSLDANLFQRVLDNLISNALKFSPDESTVTVRVEYPETQPAVNESQVHLRVQVLDEGPGVPDEHREKIFDKFSIVDLEERGGAQTGLGLAFSKIVVEAHGGKIFVESNQPQGAVFTVEI